MNKTEPPYQPVDCGTHSEYELAIMHRIMLHLVWLDGDNKQHIANLLPLDLKLSQQVEYLVGQTNDGEWHEIRLDKILQSNVSEVIK